MVYDGTCQGGWFNIQALIELLDRIYNALGQTCITKRKKGDKINEN